MALTSLSWNSSG